MIAEREIEIYEWLEKNCRKCANYDRKTVFAFCKAGCKGDKVQMDISSACIHYKEYGKKRRRMTNDEALKRLNNIDIRDALQEDYDALDMAIKALEQEPKTGYWRHYEGMLICSECGSEFYDDIMEYCGDDVPKYCPDCGTKMDKLESEE